MKSKLKYILTIVGVAIIIFGALIPAMFKAEKKEHDKLAFTRNMGNSDYTCSITITSTKDFEVNSAVVYLQDFFEKQEITKSVNSSNIEKTQSGENYVYTFTINYSSFGEFSDFSKVKEVQLNTSVGTRVAKIDVDNKSTGWQVPVMVAVITMGVGLTIAGVVIIKSSKQLEERANKARKELAGTNPEINTSVMTDEEVLMKRKELRMKKESNKAEILETILGIEEKPKEKICEYCGSINSSDAKKCSSCGANLKSKK